mgnify:FL=1
MTNIKSPEHNAMETLAVLAFVSLAIGLFFTVKVLFFLALCLLFVGIFLKALSIRIAGIWLEFSTILGGISSRIILTVIFFVFLTPIAFFYRISHGDFISLKRKGSSDAKYWKQRNYEFMPKDFENPW